MYREVAVDRGPRLVDHPPRWQSELDKGEDGFRTFAPNGLRSGAAGWEKVVTVNVLSVLGVKKARK